jgi:hypothetical protein
VSKGFAPMFRLAYRASGDPHHDDGPRSPGVAGRLLKKHLSFPGRGHGRGPAGPGGRLLRLDRHQGLGGQDRRSPAVSITIHPGNWAASAVLKARPEWLICAPRQILQHG